MYRADPYAFGFVYVLSNPAMPGLVKVGRTDRTSDVRADELHTTGVPSPFEVEFRSITSKPKEVEKRAHGLLAAHRVNPKREFFNVPVDDAVKAVREALQAANSGRITPRASVWNARLKPTNAGETSSVTSSLSTSSEQRCRRGC